MVSDHDKFSDLTTCISFYDNVVSKCKTKTMQNALNADRCRRRKQPDYRPSSSPSLLHPRSNYSEVVVNLAWLSAKNQRDNAETKLIFGSFVRRRPYTTTHLSRAMPIFSKAPSMWTLDPARTIRVFVAGRLLVLQSQHQLLCVVQAYRSQSRT